jgi:hypothetical protein
MNAMNMGAAFNEGHSAGWISNHSELWGYTKPVPPSTIRGFAKEQRDILARNGEPAPVRPRKPRPTDVPVELLEKATEFLVGDAEECGNTTTTVLRNFFARNGRPVSKSFVSGFLDKENFGLYQAKPRSTSELDDEVEITARIMDIFQKLRELREAGVRLDQICSYDEKPLVYEQFRQKVIRRKGQTFAPVPTKPEAVVASQGKERARVTGIFPTRCGKKNGTYKLPLVLIFRGENQLKVEVLPGMPVLVVFTTDAMSNSEVFNYIIHNAILPNLEGDNLLLADDHGSHFSAASREYAKDWTTKRATLKGLVLQHPLSK